MYFSKIAEADSFCFLQIVNFSTYNRFLIWAMSCENLFMPYANNKDAD